MSVRISSRVIEAAKSLVEETGNIQFDLPVAFTYNPLTYAWAPHAAYLEKYANTKKKHLFLGMNPGPFGMAQTGVPFGEIDAVTNWLKIKDDVKSPPKTHPKRPVTGFDCTKSEVSGRRLWGLFREIYSTADHFFEQNFVANYCPLIWMNESGANITPDKLPKNKRIEVEQICDNHLAKLILILEPDVLIGVGAYALKKLEKIITHLPAKNYTTGTILHPSPASPIANKLWPQRPLEQLKELGIIE